MTCLGRNRIGAEDRRRAMRRMQAGLTAIIVALGLSSAPAPRAATITVNTLNDSSGMGGCSLRDAIITANGTNISGSGCPVPTADPSNTINFSPTGTIVLKNTLPAITGNLSITAMPGADRIKIDGVNQYRIMIVTNGAIVRLRNVVIENGLVVPASRAKGGGIENAGTLTITNGLLYHNSSGPAGFFGGGIYNSYGATLTTYNTAFVDNMGGVAAGAGIFNGGALTVIGSGFHGNNAENAGAAGIKNDRGGTLAIANTSFFHNQANVAGGGAIRNEGSLVVVNSVFADNSARVGGGAILNDGTATITNSTLSGNSTTVSIDPSGNGGGGAIENISDGILTITNTTFSGNSAKAPRVRDVVAGGDILNHGKVTLKGTILAASPSTPNCAGASIIDAGYNISDDKSCALSAIGSRNNTDPKLDPAGLARNGGLTDTIALQMDSPAVNQIPPGTCTYPAGSLNPCSNSTSDQLTCDQRGFSRPGGHSCPNCDIGAYELQECTGAHASAPTLWPPNHEFVYESVLGVNDVRITGIDQDEPVDKAGFCRDANGIGSSLAQVRVERDDSGDGRVYHLQFTAIDTVTSTSCNGEVRSACRMTAPTVSAEIKDRGTTQPYASPV